MRSVSTLLLAFLVFATSSAQETRSTVAPGRDPVGVVCRVKVVSDKVPDISSLEAWKKSFIKDGMTDEEKALACWRSVVTFQHQDSPPNEFLQSEEAVMDAIKLFNVYGYSLCSVAACEVASLARYVGLQARGWGINSHSVEEVFWDGAWHLLDASLINYFKKPDGKIASVEDLIAATNEWYEKNPGFKGNNDKLVAFHREGGWQGWKKGPELLKTSPTMDAGGWWPAKTHGWYATMQEYDGTGGGGGKAFLYEYGYSQGYEVNVRLRPGERLTRNWSHKGLHVNMKEGGPPGCAGMKTGQDSLVYTPKYGDIAPGRVGNGTHEYAMPVATPAYRTGALSVENLEETRAAVKDGSKPGVLVVRMPSSYVYLSGKLAFKAIGAAAVSFSDNNGLDWKEIAKGAGEQEIDLSPHVFRRYDYRLRFELQGKGTALESLKMTHDIQHSQRPLPALGEGSNAITFSAGPAESTVTVEGHVNVKNKAKQLVFTDFHPQVEGMENGLWVAGKGQVTFPVSTPGEMTRLRFGTHHRARDARDGLDYQVSFDGGKTWKTADRAAGPTPGHCKYITFSDVPPGTKHARVRFAGTSRNATGILGFRIDADYKEPFGGFRPVKVTYSWEENGQPKQNVFVAKKPQEAYTIACAARPTMKSIVFELAE